MLGGLWLLTCAIHTEIYELNALCPFRGAEYYWHQQDSYLKILSHHGEKIFSIVSIIKNWSMVQYKVLLYIRDVLIGFII